MEAILDDKGLLPWIKGKKKKPEIQIVGDPEEIQVREDEIKEWEKKDHSARTIITINLGNNQIEQRGQSGIDSLIRRLYCTYAGEGDNIGKHMKELCKI
ncbi:uncharacterized protein LAESUDRAFT_755839 [Laetiporus sulphureus 93-53]|uniref:Uncharacterized protein n=1 Tax=Laetiporus sulphureus 93-53 TaxID=1314785 RepID=A0A165GH12_9APHY|nr:uncharacterized protein LAESUDRAFT_755839 [Laetiporus sulphureus 93-53]KZT10335.1 hypothetical protein LAESUDRAFT_755839 [Laetiporus sulphureus 93-53]